MNSYRFSGGEQRRPVSGPLPEGDYSFEVAEYQEPYQKANGNWVLKVRLTIEGQTVFDQPWSGTDKNDEKRDGVGSFLLAINRAPTNKGDEPDWRKVEGARGRCRLKVEIAQMGALAGKEVNRVAYYYVPKQVGPSIEPTKQSFSPAEVNKSMADQRRRSAGPAGPDLEQEPEDIPF
jgi:hypothetical protein